MPIKELIRRILAGENLSSIERAELENFDPDSLTAELSEVRSQLESFENEKLSHAEKLQKELDSVRQSYSVLENDHNELRRQYRIEKITSAAGCTDPGYFDYRARQLRLDLEDEAAVKEFTAALAADSPGCFKARIAPGSSAGTPVGTKVSGSVSADVSDRIGRIAESLNSVNAVMQ